MQTGEKAPWFKLFAFAWDSDFTQRKLDPAGAGIYIRLLVLQWIEGALEDDLDALRAYCGASQEEWDRAWRLLEAKFPLNDGLRRNPKLESTRSDMETVARKRRSSAKNAADARWLDAPRNATASPENAEHMRDASSENAPRNATESSENAPLRCDRNADRCQVEVEVEVELESVSKELTDSDRVWWNPNSQCIEASNEFLAELEVKFPDVHRADLEGPLIRLSKWLSKPEQEGILTRYGHALEEKWILGKVAEDVERVRRMFARSGET